MEKQQNSAAPAHRLYWLSSWSDVNSIFTSSRPLGAAIPDLSYALDTHYPWQSEEIIAGGRIRFEDGAVTVPQGPGLGIELDKASLAKLHQQYLDCGLTERDDEVEMQKVVPGWGFKMVKW
jgi:glucarate dehydratase